MIENTGSRDKDYDDALKQVWKEFYTLVGDRKDITLEEAEEIREYVAKMTDFTKPMNDLSAKQRAWKTVYEFVQEKILVEQLATKTVDKSIPHNADSITKDSNTATFCTNCGNKLVYGTNFCAHCGSATQKTLGVAPAMPVEENINFKSNQSSTVKDNSAKNVLNLIIRFGSIIIGYALGRYLGFTFFLFVVAFWIGVWFPNWYVKKYSAINNTLVKLTAWSNILTWILPPLGILTSMATIGFAKHFLNDRNKYRILGFVCLGLAIINAVWGVFNALQN